MIKTEFEGIEFNCTDIKCEKDIKTNNIADFDNTEKDIVRTILKEKDSFRLATQ